MIAVDCQFAGTRAESGMGGNGLQTASSGVARGGAWQQTAGTSRFTGGSFLTNMAVAHAPGSGPNTAGADALGGAFALEAGSLVMEDVSLEENRALGGASVRHGIAGIGAGGAVFNSLGNAQLIRCLMRGNASLAGSFGDNGQDAFGGAFHNLGVLLLRDCLIEGNSTLGGMNTPLFNSSFHPGAGCGGGVWNGGTAHLTGSTLHGNRAVGMDGSSGSGPVPGWHAFGGGIYNTGIVTMVNVTVAGNIAHGGDFPLPPGVLPAAGGNAFGGGIFQGNGGIIITNATIADNEARGGAGLPPDSSFGDNFNISNGTVVLFNCIVAGKAGTTNCVGVMTDGGHNLSSDATCHFAAPGSLNSTDPKLAPFADYGGPTPTIALLPGSPALDVAAAAACPATDQRGHTRPFGSGCDIGAFESSPPYTVLGRITGFLGNSADIRVTVGAVSTTPGPDGDYILHGFSAGTYTVRPASPVGVFVQSNAVVTLGPDRVVNFQCYRSNALTLELSAPGMHRVVFAGEAGRTYRLLGSSDLPNWIPLRTNVMSASGVFDYSEPDAGSPAQRFFKVLSP